MSNLQPGKYRARPVNAQFGISEKGKDFIAISFEIDFEDGSSEGVTAYQYFSTEGNIAQSMKALRNCGWRGDDLSADLQADGFGTAEVELDMQNETNPETGDVALKVKWVNRPGGPVVANPMDDNAKKAFAARLRGVALLSKPAAGAASKAPPLAPRAAAKPANGAPGPDPNDPRFANDVGAGTRDGIPFLPGSNRGSRQREHWRRFYRRTIRHESLRNVRAHREQPQQRGPPQALGSRARRAPRGLRAQGAPRFVLRGTVPEARGLRRSRKGTHRGCAQACGGAAGEGVAAVTAKGKTMPKKLDLKKYIADVRKSNRAFAKMSPEAKRVAIAKDVLAALAAKRITAQTGIYVDSEGAFDDEKTSNKLTRKLLTRPDSAFTAHAACAVCAKGALFVAKVDRLNGVTNNAARLIGDPSRSLVDTFAQDQLNLIESAFEAEEDDAAASRIAANGPADVYDRALAFGAGFNTDRKRLAAIMRNIIANNGTFAP